MSEQFSEEGNVQRFLQSPDRWPLFDGYKPLDPQKREIRVLHISFQSNDSSQICGRLEHVSLDDAPTFEAVSYYWGPPSQHKPILLDGKRVFIRATLHSLMTILCGKGLETPLWLDALCINQRDDAERSQQVAMMSDIYRNARGIKSWIGNGDYDTDYALGFLQHRRDATLASSVSFREVHARAQEALLQVARVPYWSRLWVLQELALARTVTVYCGLQTVSWTDLIDAVNESLQSTTPDPFLQDWDDKVQHITRDLIWQPLLALDAMINTIRQTSPQHFNLLDQVFAFHHYPCVDMRDKMFGLLSLAAPESHPVVDYTASFVDVFTDMLCQSLGLFSKHISDSQSFTHGIRFRLTVKIRRLLHAFDIKEASLGNSLQLVFNDRNHIFNCRKVGVVRTNISPRPPRSRYWNPNSWLLAPCRRDYTPEPGDEIVSVLCHDHEIQIPKLIVRRDALGQIRIIGATWRFSSLEIDRRFSLVAQGIARGHVEVTVDDASTEPDKLRFGCSRAFALAVFINFMLDMSSQRPHLDVFLNALRRNPLEDEPLEQRLVDDQSRERSFTLFEVGSSLMLFSAEEKLQEAFDGDDGVGSDWTALTHCLERYHGNRSLSVEEENESE